MMREGATACTLRYLVKGIVPSREAKEDLANELWDILPNTEAVTVLPVVDGFSVELEVADVAPFSRSSFEPYVAEHVLADAVRLRCQTKGPVRLQLLRSKFS
jgi:hypothetical protein